MTDPLGIGGDHGGPLPNSQDKRLSRPSVDIPPQLQNVGEKRRLSGDMESPPKKVFHGYKYGKFLHTCMK